MSPLSAAVLLAMCAACACPGAGTTPPPGPPPTTTEPLPAARSASSAQPPPSPAAASDQDRVDEDRVRSAATDKYWQEVEKALQDGSAERQGFLEEGDILVPPPHLRNADVDSHSRWPNRAVVLDIAPGEWSAADLRLLTEALEDMQSVSCVRFIRRTSQADYLLLRHSGRGCASLVGFHEGAGRVPTFLSRPCLRRGTIQHEMLHNLGMWHEHTRPDRDRHVDVLWDHIIPGRQSNFLRRPTGTVTTLGLPYDYGSVMHYSSTAFSRNGLPTIMPKVIQALAVMGQRRRFSSLDILKLNTLYQCPAQYSLRDNVNLDTALVDLFNERALKTTVIQA